MKLCWDNIENIRLTKKGNFRDIIKKRTLYLKVCETCGEEFLAFLSSKGMYCCKKCLKHSEETKEKISASQSGENNPMWGKTHSKESKEKNSLSVKKLYKDENSVYNSEKYKQKLSNVKMGSKNSNWKGGYNDKNIPLYDTYAPQLEWVEEVRRNPNDKNVLEVRCFKCNEWYVPTLNNVHNRMQYLKSSTTWENHFYCSDQCKNTCSIFHKSPETLMKEDAIRAGRLPWIELTREVQPELRRMVLERDGGKCVKCGNTENIQCHHIYPVSTNPLESADIDNCMMLCIECHKEVHQKDGCKINQLRMENC